jgi:drug/metabolite transporter (DMT)-like permease
VRRASGARRSANAPGADATRERVALYAERFRTPGRAHMLAGVRRLPAEVLLLGTVLLWSFNFTAVRYGVTHGVQPLVYVSLRWLIAGIVLGAIVRVRGRPLWFGRRDFLVVASASVVGVVVNQVAFSYSLHLAAASTVALVFGTLPIFVSLLSHLAGHERLQRRHWLAVGVSFVGVALVAAASTARRSVRVRRAGTVSGAGSAPVRASVRAPDRR